MHYFATMQTAKRLEGIGEYFFSQKLREIEQLRKQGKNIINLGIGNPDLPPHASVIEVLQKEAAKPNVHGYQSYKGSLVLRQAVADWYKKYYDVNLNPEEEILPLLGSKEGIMHICMTYLQTGDEALIPNPGYPTYKAAAMLAGAKVKSYSLLKKNNWFPDLVTLDKKNLSKVKLMFVNYPHMPSGQLASKENFSQLIAFAKKHNILLVHDNPYSFILNENPLSILSVDGAMDQVLELNSLSKSHNMAGWRVGMLCGNKKFIDEVLRFKSNMDSGMFLPAQLAAAKALSLPAEWYAAQNKVYEKRKLAAIKILKLLKCKVSDKQVGLFIWAEVGKNFADGHKLSDHILYEANVFITPGGIFGSAGNNYVRISLCSSEATLEQAYKNIETLLSR